MGPPGIHTGRSGCRRLYNNAANLGREAYLLLRAKGTSRNVIQFHEQRTCLPTSIPEGEPHLNIPASTNCMTVVSGEQQKAKGISMIIIENGGELSPREMLSDLTNASNRAHGVSIGKTKSRPPNRPAENAGKHKDRDASNYVSGMNLPRMMAKSENRLSNLRGKLTRDATYDEIKGLANNQAQKALQKTRKTAPQEEKAFRETPRPTYSGSGAENWTPHWPDKSSHRGQ